MNNFLPLTQFLSVEIKPEEFIEQLDAIEHECSIILLEKPELAGPEIKESLYYLHRFRKTLEKCK